MTMDPTATKYLIKANIRVDGTVEQSDVIGAIFGQTEGLIGDELDLRDLQKSARVGRIEVNIDSNKGKSAGTLMLHSAMEKVETSILAAAIESVDRIGPCKAEVKVDHVEDVRISKRKKVLERAKQLLGEIIKEDKEKTEDLAESVRQAVQVEEITSYGPDKLPAGPNISKSDAIILVEGRNDVANLLKHGIKNVISVEGTNIPQTIIDLCEERVATAFVDGDRGGSLILKELFQVADIDFVARAPKTREVEEIPQKLLTKALKNKIPAEQYAEMYGIKLENKEVKINKDQDQYKQMLAEVTGKHKGVFLDKNGKKMAETSVDSLVNELKDKNPHAIVFDGIITQRLVDIAQDRGVKTIVSIKIGDIAKKPGSLELIEAQELGL
jgi:DNA primase